MLLNEKYKAHNYKPKVHEQKVGGGGRRGKEGKKELSRNWKDGIRIEGGLGAERGGRGKREPED